MGNGDSLFHDLTVVAPLKPRLLMMASTRTPAVCLVPTRALLARWTAALAEVWDGPVDCLGDGEREALHRRDCATGQEERPVRAGGRGVREMLDGGPDRIRTGDLQRDRLACLAATPRVLERAGRIPVNSAFPCLTD